MNLYFNTHLTKKYKSKSQIIRVLSENWVYENIYCPYCGNKLSRFKNNTPVGDFYCTNCEEEFELKSKKKHIGNKILDGAYKTMLNRLRSYTNPHLFVLSYNSELKVNNFLIIPKYFFIIDIIEKRKPLSNNAKRKNWIGCNILINRIPKPARIFYINEEKIINKNIVMHHWNKLLFMKKFYKNEKNKTWLFDIISCIDMLGKEYFNLKEIYVFEKYLYLKHSQNNNIKAKIRQQLQILRDMNYIEFLGRGEYRVLIK